jgi:hypothetical protein
MTPEEIACIDKDFASIAEAIAQTQMLNSDQGELLKEVDKMRVKIFNRGYYRQKGELTEYQSGGNDALDVLLSKIESEHRWQLGVEWLRETIKRLKVKRT